MAASVEVKEIGAGHDVWVGRESGGVRGMSEMVGGWARRQGFPVRVEQAEGEAGHKISVWKVYAIGKSGLAV